MTAAKLPFVHDIFGERFGRPKLSQRPLEIVAVEYVRQVTLRLFTPKAPIWQAFLYLSTATLRSTTATNVGTNQRLEALASRLLEWRVARASFRRRVELVPVRSMAASARLGKNAARRSRPDTRKRLAKRR